MTLFSHPEYDDHLRLSRAMSYKCALAGLPGGGGKSVIIGDPATLKTPELLAAYGRYIESLGGTYVAGRADQSGEAHPATLKNWTGKLG